MGGQPWLEFELHGRRHRDSPERGERGKEEGERGHGWGCCLRRRAWEGAEELGLLLWLPSVRGGAPAFCT
jgi:hypothetical protein